MGTPEALPSKHFTLRSIKEPDKGGIYELLTDRWWWTVGDDGLFYTARGSNSPQCNGSREVAERWRIPVPGATLKFVPKAWFAVNIADYEM